MYEHVPERVASKGKFRLVGFDPNSSRTFLVSEHKTLEDANRQKKILKTLVKSHHSDYGNLQYSVYNDNAIEQATYQRQWGDDFFCGIHSNIPLCCVLWYCDVWSGNLSDQFRFSNTLQYEYHPENNSNPIQPKASKRTPYAMCPDCLAKNIEGKTKPAILKSCSCDGRPMWPPKGKFKVITRDTRINTYSEKESYDSIEPALEKAKSLQVLENIQTPLEKRKKVLVSSFVLDGYGNYWFT